MSTETPPVEPDASRSVFLPAPAPEPEPAVEPTVRLDSIDAYRGAVMSLRMAEVLRLGAMSENFPGSDD